MASTVLPSARNNPARGFKSKLLVFVIDQKDPTASSYIARSFGVERPAGDKEH